MSAQDKVHRSAALATKIAKAFGLDFNPADDTAHFWRMMRKGQCCGYIASREAISAMCRSAEGYPSFNLHFSIEVATPELIIVKCVAQSPDMETQWAEVGEASPRNVNLAHVPYPAAMAWKRARARAVLGYLGLDGFYSEDEADAFENPSSRQPQAQPVQSGGWGGAPQLPTPNQMMHPHIQAPPAPIQPVTPVTTWPAQPPLPPQPHTTDQGATYTQPAQPSPPQPYGQPAAPGAPGQPFPPALSPDEYMRAIQSGEAPPMDPAKMMYKGGKYSGQSWLSAYCQDHQLNGATGKANYTEWRAGVTAPWSMQAEGKEPTDFTIKMWATLTWIFTRVDPVTGLIKPLEQCVFPWHQPPQAAHPTQQPINLPPPGAVVDDDLGLGIGQPPQPVARGADWIDEPTQAQPGPGGPPF